MTHAPRIRLPAPRGQPHLRPRALLVSALAVVLAWSGCGDDEGDQGGTGKRGGSITISHTSQPDFLDPALSFSLNGWEALWIVYTPLLTYAHEEGRAGTRLIPGLAEELPEISEDGLTYTLRLRDGLRYSDGRSVRASDFEHTIKRVLALESQGTSYYRVIDGAGDYIRAGKPEADLAGIETDDASGRITIRLAEPSGTFANVLAMNFAGLVPGDTPFENQTRDPPPGVGAYRITSSVPNREFVLERNERFDVPGIPKGKVDRIRVEMVSSLERQAQDVIRGRLDFMDDAPPPDLLAEIRHRYRDRFETFSTGVLNYFWLNVREEPFDDRRVRVAANLALDRPGLARLLGGLLEPGCNLLPPAIPGHERLERCPGGVPAGGRDVERARRLVRAAGAEGADVKVWGTTEEPGRAVAIAFADMLGEAGLDAEPRLLAFAVWLSAVGNQDTRAQTGLVGWSPSYPHPADYLGQFSGAHITRTGNLNKGNVDDPRITAAITRLEREPDLDAVADDWAQVDRDLSDGAYAAVVGYQKLTTFMSERMNFDDCSLNHPIYAHDYSSFCLK
jgi:peptide/nickel transport system substrate-binding protein